MDLASSMQIVTVLHRHEDGFHTFTSPEIPGLYMVVTSDDLQGAYRDLPRALEKLIFADSGKRVRVEPAQTYDAYLKSRPDSHLAVTHHYQISKAA